MSRRDDRLTFELLAYLLHFARLFQTLMVRLLERIVMSVSTRLTQPM